MGCAQAGDRARDGDRYRPPLVSPVNGGRPTVVGRRLTSVELEHIWSGCGRRADIVVDGDELPRIRQEECHVTVAAQSATGGLHDLAGERGRDDGIDCIPACLEHPHPGVCLLDVATRDDAAIGDDLGTARRTLVLSHQHPGIGQPAVPRLFTPWRPGSARPVAGAAPRSGCGSA
jgi:hypothetical protein